MQLVHGIVESTESIASTTGNPALWIIVFSFLSDSRNPRNRTEKNRREIIFKEKENQRKKVQNQLEEPESDEKRNFLVSRKLVFLLFSFFLLLVKGFYRSICLYFGKTVLHLICLTTPHSSTSCAPSCHGLAVGCCHSLVPKLPWHHI